ncbi:MAG: hypothetical protein ACRDZ9_07290 [Acidimicrobiales bacterium]
MTKGCSGGGPGSGDDRSLARLLATGRVAVGGLVLLVPGATAGWVGPVAREPGARALARALGVRDLLLGVLTLRALDREAPVGALVRAGVAADAVDLAATVLSYRHLPRRSRVAVAAASAGAVALGWRLSRSGVRLR